MKALILVGGYGTRLRPLTLTKPKPLIDFCNKPILFYQIEALVDVGVTIIVLAVSYMSDQLETQLKQLENRLNVKLILSHESTPLGTAGPLALARKHLTCDESPIFVMNSDIICTFPLKDMHEFHLKHGAQATLATTTVLQPFKYGVVVTDEKSKITKFVEKPQVFISSKINAGLYIINPSVIDEIELKPTSLEKEVFPKLVEIDQIYAFSLKGLWMDIGQPKDYLIGIKLYLEHLQEQNSQLLCNHSENIVGNVMIDDTAVLGKNCRIGPNVVIGPNTHIGDGTFLSNCVIMQHSIIKSCSYITNTIVGSSCSIGSWVRIEREAVLGENVTIDDETYLNGCKILPHKVISNSIYDCQVVM